jgi:hypothetical protein
MNEDEIRRGITAHEAALRRLRDGKPGKQTSGYEAVYGQTYQYLVRLGAKPQIKHKYRSAK